MMRCSLVVIGMMCLGSASPCPAQSTKVTIQGDPVVQPRSVVKTVKGPSGGYRIFVSWPAAPPPPQGYPILYLLDGDESFPIATAIADGLGPYIGLEPGIIVGIGYGGQSHRGFDDTPAVPPGTPMLMPSGPNGGADKMLDFIADVVKPMVEAQVPIDRRRQAIAGYSLGGLFVLHALFTRPTLFQTYVASSPSIWFGQRQVLAREGDLAAKLPGAKSPTRLILTVGQYEQEPVLSPGAKPDADWQQFVELSRKARTIDNAKDLATRLGALRAQGLTVTFKVNPGESHATGDIPSIRDALAGAFAKP